MKELKTNQEFKELIPPLTEEEFKQLKENILKDGCLSPLIIWNTIIIDGHNRFEICNENNIEFEITNIEFTDENEAKEWIINNQFGRRNLSPYTRSKLALKLRELWSEKAKQQMGGSGRFKPTLAKTDEDEFWELCNKPILKPINTRKELSKISGVSHGTLDKVKFIEEKIDNETKIKLDKGLLTINSVYKDLDRQEKIENSKNLVLKNINISIENKIENTDAITFLKSLLDKSVSMVLTDPPYGINFKPTRAVGNEIFNDSEVDTLELLENTCKELLRVCKENTHLYFFVGYSTLKQFQEIIGRYFNIEPNPLIWVKNNHTMCDFKKHYANKYEFIIFAKNSEGRLLNNSCSPDVLEYNKPTNRIHDCEKPTELLEYLIKNSSIEGEVILDPFGGSLSTYRACISINRKCFTCELSEEIYKKAINEL